MKGLIFTYLLTACGAINGLVYPYLGVLVYVCLAIIKPEAMWPWAVTEGRFSFIVGVALLAGWLLNSFGDWRIGKGSHIVFLLLAYWGWMILSLGQARDPEKGTELVIFFAKVILPFLAGVSMVRSVQELRWLAWVIVLAMGYLAFELNLSYYGGYNRVVEEGFGGMDNNCVAIAMVTAIGFAFFLGMGAKRWWMSCIALGCAALMGHVILMSMSRGGMLALLLTSLMGAWLLPKQPKHYVVFALGCLLMIRLAGPKVQERFLSSFDKSEDTQQMEASAQSRVDLWRDASDAALKEPVLGVGPDSWGATAPTYGWPKGKEVHSLWMQNAAELGFPGVFFLFTFFVLLVVYLWPLTSEKTPVADPWVREGARMVIAALFGFVISAQFVTIKFLELPFYISMLGVGLLKIQAQFKAGGFLNNQAQVQGVNPQPVMYLPRMRRAAPGPKT